MERKYPPMFQDVREFARSKTASLVVDVFSSTENLAVPVVVGVHMAKVFVDLMGEPTGTFANYLTQGASSRRGLNSSNLDDVSLVLNFKYNCSF